MGTGTSLRVLSSEQSKKVLSPIDEEKVSNIVEVCNVSRDEAVRVLDACRMDETMAMERFLSGTEVSTWSQVSKKKRQLPQSRSSSGARSGNAHGRTHEHERDRERDMDRKDRARSHSYSSDHSTHQNGFRRGQRNHSQQQRSKDHTFGLNKKRSHQHETATSQPMAAEHPPEQTESWGTPPQDNSWADHSSRNGQAGESWPDPQATTSEPWVDSNRNISSTEPTSTGWSTPQPTPSTPSSAWQRQNSTDDRSKNVDVVSGEQHSPSPHAPRAVESPSKQLVLPPVAMKKTFNYAAAAASGTSHEKPAPLPPEVPSQASVKPSINTKPSESDAAVPDALQEAMVAEGGGVKQRRGRAGRKQPSLVEIDRQPTDGHAEPRHSSEGNAGTYDSSGGSGTAGNPENLHLDGSSRSGGWGQPSKPPIKGENGKYLEKSAAAVPVASAAVTGRDQIAGDSLSLQFGSFGLGGLDGVNWSASEQKAGEAVRDTLVSSDTTAVAPASSIPVSSNDASGVTNSAISSEPTGLGLPSTSLPKTAPIDVPENESSAHSVRVHPTVSPPAPQPVTSSSAGSGVFPILPIGHGGSFAPPNYGTPYLIPPLHGYSPAAMTSYENGGDAGSSRAPSLVPPGSLPMYDPAAMPGMTATNGKYGGIPGLGEMSGLHGTQPPTSKETQHGIPTDLEKSSSGATSGLPAGMDPLAAPYMMPGYPSMQYPMYTFPTGPYAPPGMGPPGPSPFPYPPPGQVSSQGGRGGFGFDEGSVGLTGSSRSGTGLSESMYTPAYLNTSMNHSSSQKAPGDGSFKPVRGNPANSLAGVGMGGGMVPGLAYGDYPGSGMPAVSNGVGAVGSVPATWNNSRQLGGSRGDSANGTGVVSNQPLNAASPSSSVYAAGPGAHGGYWGPQQGGYYP